MEENNQVTELQIIQAKQAAEFAMTPVGQTVKQFEVMQRHGQHVHNKHNCSGYIQGKCGKLRDCAGYGHAYGV